MFGLTTVITFVVGGVVGACVPPVTKWLRSKFSKVSSTVVADVGSVANTVSQVEKKLP